MLQQPAKGPGCFNNISPAVSNFRQLSSVFHIKCLEVFFDTISSHPYLSSSYWSCIINCGENDYFNWVWIIVSIDKFHTLYSWGLNYLYSIWILKDNRELYKSKVITVAFTKVQYCNEFVLPHCLLLSKNCPARIQNLSKQMTWEIYITTARPIISFRKTTLCILRHILSGREIFLLLYVLISKL